MSLEIIEHNTSNSNESELLATIEQRTGLKLTALESANFGKYYNVRFPDMEESQKVEILSFTTSGTVFIDVTNHFLCYTVASGTEDYNYVDKLYRAIVYDFNGVLANVTQYTDCEWERMMNINMSRGGYLENDYSKNDITLVSLRVEARNWTAADGQKYAKGFIKNCYVNYERQFQKGLKFIEPNGNRFVTLGGYLLYKID